jgi:hypothetical protein
MAEFGERRVSFVAKVIYFTHRQKSPSALLTNHDSEFKLMPRSRMNVVDVPPRSRALTEDGPAREHARSRPSNFHFSIFIFQFSILLSLTSSLSAAPFPRTLTTSHYRIHTDLDASLAIDLSLRMDAMFDEYARRFSGITDLRRAAPSDVYLFRFRSDYVAFVGSDFENTSGIFIPGQNCLAAFLEGQGRDALRRTLQHEAFHQFALLALGRDLPPWLNEGLAQIFEESLWTGDRFLLYQIPPRRVRQVQADLLAQRWLDLRDLVQLSPQQWAGALADDSSIARSRYNQAWTFVQFLANASDENGNTYLPRLLTVLQAIRDGHDARRAFVRSFPDLHSLNSRFDEFARAIKPTAEALMVERQQVLADLMIELSARESLPRDCNALLQRLRRDHVQLHYSMGDLHWTSDPDVAVYFADWNGKALGRGQLNFVSAPVSAPPEIICRLSSSIGLHTRFNRSLTGKLEHETFLSPAMASAD